MEILLFFISFNEDFTEEDVFNLKQWFKQKKTYCKLRYIMNISNTLIALQKLILVSLSHLRKYVATI